MHVLRVSFNSTDARPNAMIEDLHVFAPRPDQVAAQYLLVPPRLHPKDAQPPVLVAARAAIVTFPGEQTRTRNFEIDNRPFAISPIFWGLGQGSRSRKKRHSGKQCSHCFFSVM